MATETLGRVYAGWDLERAELIGEVTSMSLTMEEFAPPAHGLSTYVGPVSGTFIFDLTAKQAEIMARILGFHYLAPAPVKPAFRGRRHGW